jgi:hypothetical protein
MNKGDEPAFAGQAGASEPLIACPEFISALLIIPDVLVFESN